MPIIKKNGVEIYYEEAGTGFPLLVLPGGGLNATVASLKDHAFNPISEFSNKYRVIALDLRNANAGKTIGPLEIEKTWAHAPAAFLHPDLGLKSLFPTFCYYLTKVF